MSESDWDVCSECECDPCRCDEDEDGGWATAKDHSDSLWDSSDPDEGEEAPNDTP